MEPNFGEYLIVVAIRGSDTENLNLTATGHKRINEDSDIEVTSEREGFFAKNNYKSIEFRITQSLDVFSHEV